MRYFLPRPGHVVDVDHQLGLFAVEFDGGLCADFEIRHLPNVADGDYVSVGPDSISHVDLGVWSREEIEGALTRARELRALITP